MTDKIKLNSNGELQSPKKDPSPESCNARLKGGSYCENPPTVTDRGLNRCKTHGGIGSGRPKKSFSAGEFLNNDIVRMFENLGLDEPETLLNLDSEISVVRTNLYSYLKTPEIDKVTQKPIPPSASTIKQYTDSIAKLIELKTKIEGNREATKSATHIVISYVNAVTKILERHITDLELRKRISSDMKSLTIEVAEKDGL